MQYLHIGYRIKGLYKIANFSNKLEAIMGTKAQQKLDALSFWDKHGIIATQDAFKVSRTTLYRWRKLHAQRGMVALRNASTAPQHRRSRNWSPHTIAEIRRLRISYPNAGSEKVYRKLKNWCDERTLACPKPCTIARLIADAPDRMRCSLPSPKIKRKTKPSKRRLRLGKEPANYPGHCIAMDTIHYFVNHTRYYLFTAVDHYSCFAIAIAVRRANSKTAAEFARLVETVFPNHITQILTDNGSEFQGDFDAYLQERNIKHCYTYPRSPKMNAFNERFNRTIQEEFVIYHEDLLMEDLSVFNDVLFEYLGRFNFKRPHQGLGFQTPVQRFAASFPDLSHMSWHRTILRYIV